MSRANALRAQIMELVSEFAEVAHSSAPFVPGDSPVPVSGKVYGAEEIKSLVDASLDFWLTTGRFNREFEHRLATFLDVRHALTTNSGSSANLLAIAALTSPKLGGKRLQPGDEVITAAAAFPTTVSPMLQYGLIPVFVDVDIPTYNVDPRSVEAAITPKTRAIMVAHTLGNPFNASELRKIADRHGLWLIEDCCDALGSRFEGRLVGTFGDLATMSFYPAHHITMGEGGAVVTKSVSLKPLVESFRDWGRDCWCDPGRDNTCGKRFQWKTGSLPDGYDHKYTYSHAGYNLKITDMQAAVGLAQLDRLPEFIDARINNFAYLKELLSPLRDFMILPEKTVGSDPAWFGFPITLRPECPIRRTDMCRYLDNNKIATRLLFAGNIVRQPFMAGRDFRIAGPLTNSDIIMERTFWVGVYPGLTRPMLEYVAERMSAALTGRHACV